MHCRLFRDLNECDSIDSQDRGLHYGDGLFETMLLQNGMIKYWPEHFKRLSASAKKLQIACPDKDWFERQLKPYVNLNLPLIIKIILTRGSGGRGLDFSDNITPNVHLLKYQSNININQTVKASISEITLPLNKNLSGHKHLNRLDYVLATLELNKREGFNESLLFDNNGFIIEGIVNNFFFIRNSVVFTPDLITSGVDGIMRGLILKRLKQLKKQVKIGFFTESDFLTADECFFSNSVQGIRPVIQIENTAFKVGPFTKDLQKYFHGHSGN